MKLGKFYGPGADNKSTLLPIRGESAFLLIIVYALLPVKEHSYRYESTFMVHPTLLPVKEHSYRYHFYGPPNGHTIGARNYALHFIEFMQNTSLRA